MQHDDFKFPTRLACVVPQDLAEGQPSKHFAADVPELYNHAGLSHLELRAANKSKFIILLYTLLAMAESHALAMPKQQAPANILRFTMNKLRSKKKAAPEPLKTNNDIGFGFGPTSPPIAQPDIKKSSGSRWGRKKQAEPQPDLDFELSLPSNDDFRTSLLMPNLSARFSMLRDQDDPMSLMGKASDDSVLAPRRRSRLGDFGYTAGGLNDIAEVRSINSSIRPPFVSQDRQFSYGSEDGYGSENDSTTNGSVMSRARPGEGNNLFGGRQKIYRIPTSGANSTRSAGKAIYEDDLGKSAFQRYRQREREEYHTRPSEDSSGFDFGLDHSEMFSRDERTAQNPNDSAKDLSNSPSLSAYDKKRSTTSSVTRSEARSSTAATSVASQTVNSSSSPMVTPQIAPTASMPSFKNRRLYEQGLDQHIQDQQSSAITRLNSIQRQRNFTTGGIQSSSTLTSPQKGVRDFGDRGMNISSGHQSPTATTFGAVRKPSLNSVNGSGYGQQPVSPTAMEFDENYVLNNALEPGDRGKATALGAFNKPKNQFDERQYLERQHQMMRSQSRAGSGKDSAEVSPVEQRFGRFDQPNRLRSSSDVSARSRSGSIPKKYEPSKAYNLYQNAANSVAAVSGAQRDYSFDQNSNSRGDENGEDHQSFGGAGNRGWQPNALPSVSEHPALRAQRSKTSLNSKNQDSLPSYMRTAVTENTMPLRTDLHKFNQTEKAVDSPTLGAIPPAATSTAAPAAGPLNGMMQHLRSGSNVSSVYPNDEDTPLDDDAPALPKGPWTARDMDMHNMPIRNTLDFDPLIQASYASSNPWAPNEADNMYSSANNGRHSVSPIDERILDSSQTPMTNGSNYDHHDVSPQNEPAAMPWEDSTRKEHTRDASSATQQERDAFADELAARRNAIKENMKSLAERESNSRGVSPARSANSAFKTFGIPRSKNSRESLVSKKDITHDPMPPLRPKVFGGMSSAHGSNVDLHHDQQVPRSRDNSATRTNRPRNSSGARPPVPIVQTRTLQSSEREPARSRGYSETSLSEHRQLASERRSPATSQGPRSRSNSSTNGNGRSRSRTQPYRDDLQRAMIEGMGSSAAVHPEISPMITRETTPRISPDRSQTERGSHEQVNMTGMNNYFEPKATWQSHAQDGRGPMAGPVQTTLANTVYSAPGTNSSRPTPATSPYSQNMVSPPSTSTMTPYSSPPIQPQMQPQMQKGTLRKKTVSKSEISEPTLISSTSNVDTVDLPPGASLKNGMDEVAPLADNKRRGKGKLFGRNRSGSSVENSHYAARTKSPEGNYVPVMPPTSGPRGARSNSNMNDSIPRYDMATTLNSDSYHSNPALHDYNYGANIGSQERSGRSHIEAGSRPIDGGMF